jgi:hypothetical protein
VAMVIAISVGVSVWNNSAVEAADGVAGSEVDS